MDPFHNLEKLTLKQLRQLLKDYNVPSAGKKPKALQKARFYLSHVPDLQERIASILAETPDVSNHNAQEGNKEPEASSGAPTDNTGEENELERTDNSDYVAMDEGNDTEKKDEATLVVKENEEASEDTPQQETPLKEDSDDPGDDSDDDQKDDTILVISDSESKGDPDETPRQEMSMDGDQVRQQTGSARSISEKLQAAKDRKAQAKLKQWVYYYATKRNQKADRDKAHLAKVESVRLLCNNRREIIKEQKNFRIKAFPITLATLSDPAFVEITNECRTVNVHFSNTVKAGAKLVGHVTLTFKKKSNLDSFAEKLKALIIKGEVVAGSSGSDDSVDEFTEKFRTHCKGELVRYENTTLLVPQLPATLTEDALWDMFPTAWEILFFPRESKNDTMQSFATVYYPNMSEVNKGVSDLGQRPPVHGLTKVEMIPLNLLTPAFLREIEGDQRQARDIKGDNRRPADRDGARMSSSTQRQYAGRSRWPDNPRENSRSRWSDNPRDDIRSRRSDNPRDDSRSRWSDNPRDDRSGWFEPQSRRQYSRLSQQDPMNRRSWRQYEMDPWSGTESQLDQYSPPFDRRNRDHFHRLRDDDMYFPDQPDPQGVQPEQLEVLEQLLMDLSDQGDNTEVGEFLLSALSAGQRRRPPPPRYQQQQRPHRNEREYRQQSAPKRSHSPAMSTESKRQRDRNFRAPSTGARPQDRAPRQAVEQVAGNNNPNGRTKRKRRRPNRKSRSTTEHSNTGPPTTGAPTTGDPTTGPPSTYPATAGPPTTDPPPTTGIATTGPLTTGPATTEPPTTGPPTTGPPSFQVPFSGPPPTRPTDPQTAHASFTSPPSTSLPVTGPPTTDSSYTYPPATEQAGSGSAPGINHSQNMVPSVVGTTSDQAQSSSTQSYDANQQTYVGNPTGYQGYGDYGYGTVQADVAGYTQPDNDNQSGFGGGHEAGYGGDYTDKQTNQNVEKSQTNQW